MSKRLLTGQALLTVFVLSGVVDPTGLMNACAAGWAYGMLASIISHWVWRNK